MRDFAEWIESCASRQWLDGDPDATRARQPGLPRGDAAGRQDRLRRRRGPRLDVAAGPPCSARHRRGHLPLARPRRASHYAQNRNLRWSAGSRRPRYVNPTRTVTNPAIAYWADPGQHAGRPVIVVEGPTDALAARQLGHDVAALIGAGHAANPAVAGRLRATRLIGRAQVVFGQIR